MQRIGGYLQEDQRLIDGGTPDHRSLQESHTHTIWHLLTNGTLYVDPGADYFDRRRDPAIQAKKLASRIEALGFEVTMTKAVA